VNNPLLKLKHTRHLSVIISAILVLICLVGLSCSGQTPPSIPSSPTSAIQPSITRPISLDNRATEELNLINKTIEAMKSVVSFQSDSDVIETYSATSDKPTIYQWKGSQTVNVTDHKMQMSMNIKNDNPRASQTEETAFEMYFYNGYEYFNYTLPELYSGWSKTNLYDDWWDSEMQIAGLVDLLKTANSIKLENNEIINGINCHVLSFSSPPAAIAEWTLSQHQIVGPGKVSAGGMIKYNDDSYVDTIKLWISSNNFIVMRQKVIGSWSGALYVGAIPVPPATTQEGLPFKGTVSGLINYTNFNQPVNIELPAEALNIP
jgi:hypothetical protein